MTKHPPHHPNHSPNREPDAQSVGTGPRDAGTAFDHDGDGHPLADLVAGDPPVPITVWRTARADGDHGASIPTRLARRLVGAYSRPGEAVVDLTDDHALTTACRAGDRRHHRAWFTDVASLIIGPATAADLSTDRSGVGADGETDNETDSETDNEADDDRPLHRGARPARAVRDDTGGDGADDTGVKGESAWTPADWFGDDLTDEHLPPAASIPDAISLTGRTSLVVASWPLDPDPAAGRVRLAWLLTACRELLRPGGCLVLVVAVSAGRPAAADPAAGRGVTPEDFSPIIDAAAGTGLGYLQHIVAVAADIAGEHGDTFVYHVDDEELLAFSRARAQAEGRAWTVAHLRVHADLLVFTPAQTPPARSRRSNTRPDRADGREGGREGGGRRG
jgi:hypothetical protein